MQCFPLQNWWVASLSTMHVERQPERKLNVVKFFRFASSWNNYGNNFMIYFRCCFYVRSYLYYLYLGGIIYTFSNIFSPIVCWVSYKTFLDRRCINFVSQRLAQKWQNFDKIISQIFINVIHSLLCLESTDLYRTEIYRGADTSLARPGRKQSQKHVTDARSFNNIETCAVINFFFFCKARRQRKFTPF